MKSSPEPRSNESQQTLMSSFERGLCICKRFVDKLHPFELGLLFFLSKERVVGPPSTMHPKLVDTELYMPRLPRRDTEHLHHRGKDISGDL